jgi:hypothetical protein
MIIQVPAPTGYGGVRHVNVTLPRVDFLVAEQPAKYALPESLPAPTGPVAAQRRGARWTSHENSRLIQKRLAGD